MAGIEGILSQYGLAGVVIFMLWRRDESNARQLEDVRRDLTQALVENTKAQTALTVTVKTMADMVMQLHDDNEVKSH